MLAEWNKYLASECEVVSVTEVGDPVVVPERGQLLGDLLQGRTDVLALLGEDQFEEAAQLGDDLMSRLDTFALDTQGQDIELGLLPHVAQGIGLLADISVAAMAAGNNVRAAELLNRMGQVTERLGVATHQLAGLGLLYCKDGRPSLDGTCLKLPPCTP
jgi:hypothetical protein